MWPVASLVLDQRRPGSGSIVRRAEKLRTVQRSQLLYERRQAAQAFAGKETEVNPNLIPVGRKAAPEVFDPPPPAQGPPGAGSSIDHNQDEGYCVAICSKNRSLC